jgi:hypothetical protein
MWEKTMIRNSAIAALFAIGIFLGSPSQATWRVDAETRVGAIESVTYRPGSSIIFSGSDDLYIHDLECNTDATYWCTSAPSGHPYFNNINTFENTLGKTYADSTSHAFVAPGGYAAAEGYASASADLSTGQVKIGNYSNFASTAGQFVNGVYAAGDAFSNVQASWTDTLHFSGGTGLVTIPIDIRLDGTFGGGTGVFRFNQANFGFGADDGVQPLVSAGVRFSTYGPIISTANAVLGQDWSVSSKIGNWTQFGPDRFVGSLTVNMARPNVNIYMGLSNYNGFSDFMHTAEFNMSLPNGISYTSDSGVFLASDSGTSAVPEAATWTMLLVGFGVIGILLRRRPRSNILLPNRTNYYDLGFLA